MPPIVCRHCKCAEPFKSEARMVALGWSKIICDKTEGKYHFTWIEWACGICQQFALFEGSI